MTRTIIAGLLCSALASPLAAQQNDDGQGDGEESEGPVSGSAGLGYLATSGNTESTNANASFELTYERPLWTHEVALSAISASREGTTTAEAYTSNYQVRRDWGENNYMFTALDWRRDRFSAFDYQVSESVGYGRRLVDTERHEFNVEAGIGARQAQRQTGLERDDQIVRLGLGYTLMVNDTTEFTQDVVSESGSTNTSVESVSALRVDLFSDIGLSLSHRIRRNSDVAPDIEETDTYTSISLEYDF